MCEDRHRRHVIMFNLSIFSNYCRCQCRWSETPVLYEKLLSNWIWNELLSHIWFVEFAGREVEGFVLEPKRRNQVIEEQYFVPRGYEFSTSGTCREARLRAERSQTGHSISTTAGFFSHRSASKPRRGSCRGITSNLSLHREIFESLLSEDIKKCLYLLLFICL